mmetsp:Transcript_1115/g.1367  ORF Transcript_1115/g.1367 Transcript_1115/m.1367 type:complete len:423 (-) Transcript_1115:41-1309(-)
MFFSRTGRTYVTRRRISRENDHWCVKMFVFILATVFLVGIPLYVHSCEQELHEMTLAFTEADEVMVSVPSDQNPQAANAGELLHLQSADIRTSSTNADPDFQLAVPNSLKMKRETEYCQWFEHYTETRTKHGDEEEVVRTYHYTKGWSPHRIPSLFFDQPFRYNNPQRDPFPSHYWQAESASLGDYTIDSDIINSISSFKPKIWDSESLSEFRSSSAAAEQFNYMGNGYFYSPYESSGAETLAKLAGQFLEGSLDVQLFDFLPQCTAGDIRVRYQTVEPKEASVIGLQKDAIGSLGGWTSSRGYVVALLEEGFHTGAGMMILATQRFLHWTVWVARALMMLWSAVILVVLVPNQSLLFYAAGASGLALGALGFIWLIVDPSWYSALLSILFLAIVYTLGNALVTENKLHGQAQGIILKKSYQ